MGARGPSTIADLALLATYSTYKAMADKIGIDFSKFPDLEMWFDKMMKEARNYDKACGDGAKELAEFLAPKWK